MIKIASKHLMDYVFGENGLGYEKIDKKTLIWWLQKQNDILDRIREEVDFTDFEENELGYVEYALGDLCNFLQMIYENLG